METKPWVELLQRENLRERRRRRKPICDCCGEPLECDTYVRLSGCRYCESCVVQHTFYTQEDEEVL